VKKPITTMRTYKDTATRVRVVAAATGQHMADVIDRLVEPGLTRLEDEHVRSRYQRTEKPTRTAPPK
jgi:hypothetical protein